MCEPLRPPRANLVRQFGDRFWGADWPALRVRACSYRRARSRSTGRGASCMPRALVVDDEAVFVTSANYTEAALDRNIEFGLLVRDRALAASASTHFGALIDRGYSSPCRPGESAAL